MTKQTGDDPKRFPTVELLSTKIDVLPIAELVAFIGDTIRANRKAIVANVNVYAMNIAFEMPEFRQFLNNSDVVFCDGYGVKLGAKLVGKDLPYRYTPPDWMHLLAALCTQEGYSIFLLGAKPGVAERAADALRRDFEGLQIAGTYHGFFDKTPGSVDTQSVVETINLARPSILIVGFGMPLQEMWLRDNWPAINANVALPAGALIDYLAGEVFRAPKIFTDNGLEWLARLVIEPRRLWKRYLVGNPRFLWRVLRYDAKRHDAV